MKETQWQGLLLTHFSCLKSPEKNRSLLEDSAGFEVDEGERASTGIGAVEKDVPDDEERHRALGVKGPDLPHGGSSEALLIIVQDLTPAL